MVPGSFSLARPSDPMHQSGSSHLGVKERSCALHCLTSQFVFALEICRVLCLEGQRGRFRFLPDLTQKFTVAALHHQNAGVLRNLRNTLRFFRAEGKRDNSRGEMLPTPRALVSQHPAVWVKQQRIGAPWWLKSRLRGCD